MKARTLFLWLPEPGAGEQTFTLDLYPSQRRALERRLPTSKTANGRACFVALEPRAGRHGFSLIARDKLGYQRGVRLLEPDWKGAWGKLALGSGIYSGVEALERLEAVQARMTLGRLKKRGQRGKSTKGDPGHEELARRENLEAEILTRDSGVARLRAARDALAMPIEDLPKRIWLKLSDISSDPDPKARNSSMRELEKEVANMSRDADKAGAKADLE